MAKYGIIGPGYQGRSSNVNTSRCINLYPEINTPDSKSVGSLVGTPGLLLYVDTTLGLIRGMHFFNNLIYFVSGNKLYSVDAAQNIFPIIDSVSGNQVSLATSVGRVAMADNGMYSIGGGAANQLAFVDGQHVHILNVTTLVSTSFAVPSKTIAFIGGYFMIDIGGAQFKISSLYDGTLWPALAFSTADAYPDTLMAIINNHNESWLIGEYSAEIWAADGSANPLPFTRMTTIDYGTRAPHSVAKGSNTLFWLVSQRNGNAGELFGIGMADGYGARIVSPQAINDHLSRYSVVSDAWGYCYTDRGHEFYVLTFPTENATWIYDATTRLCHERSYYSGDPYKINRHIANAYAYAWGKHFVGSYLDGKIYEMSENYLDDDGQPIASVRVAPPMDADNANMFISKLQLDAEVGVGAATSHVWENSLSGTIAVGAGPSKMADDGSNVWVANYDDGTVSKIDPTNSTVLATVSVGLSPISIIYAANYIWVSNYTAGTVSKINTITNLVEATISVGTNPWKMAFDDNDHIWVVNSGDDTVSKINVATNTVDATVGGIGNTPQGIIFSGGFMWTSNINSNNVSKINIYTDTVVATIGVGTHPYLEMAANDAFVWVSNYTDGTVSKINCATNVVDATIAVGVNPRKTLLDGTKIWVANAGGNTVSKIDAITDAVDATVGVGTTPYDLVAMREYIFVANQGSDNVSVINIVTESVINTFAVGTDPFYLIAAADSTRVLIANYTADTVTNILAYRIASACDPTAALSWSVDGGHTWSNDHFAKMGKTGAYLTRMIWRRLGSARNRCFRLAITDAVKKVLISCYMDYTKGMY